MCAVIDILCKEKGWLTLTKRDRKGLGGANIQVGQKLQGQDVGNVSSLQRGGEFQAVETVFKDLKVWSSVACPGSINNSVS